MQYLLELVVEQRLCVPSLEGQYNISKPEVGCAAAVLFPHCVIWIPVECEDWNLPPAKAGRWRSSGLRKTTQAAAPFLPDFTVQGTTISTPCFHHQALYSILQRWNGQCSQRKTTPQLARDSALTQIWSQGKRENLPHRFLTPSPVLQPKLFSFFLTISSHCCYMYAL